MKLTLVRPRLRFVTEPEGGEPSGGAGPQGGQEQKPADTPADKTGGDQPLGEAGIRALQAERDRAAKAERDLAALRKEIDDAKLTTEQKTAADLAAAQRDAADAALRALRYEVAAEKGLDLKLAGRLTGATKAELEVDADALKELVKAPATGPKPDRSQGGGSTDKGTSVSAGRDLWAERHPSKTS